MKMTKALLFGAVAVAALTTVPNLRATDFSRSDLANRAVAASPRALEQFPWLARQASPRTELTARSESVPASIKKNRALAVSPRILEQFPEMARAAQPPSVASAKPGTGVSQFSEVTKNRAVAASPRALEQFPWLARGYKSQPAERSFEVAPLK